MLNVSTSAHLRSSVSTKSIMRDVAISLLPVLAFGVYHFGIRALFVILASIASCVAFEALFELITKKPITVTDYSAVVTGMILAINLPATVPMYIPVLGGAFAIIVVKMLFGGLGQNFMNPALGARCFLLISFASIMNDFSIDGVSSATPLAALANGEEPDLLALFVGNHAGCIGEVSALAILVGAIYLVIKKVISLRIPLAYILSTVVFIVIIQLVTKQEISATYLVAQVLSGGLLVGAFYMATDYVTSPITPTGKIVYGIFLGFLTALFRLVGSSAEGVSYAIIIGNLLVPIIERLTVPKAFGAEHVREENK